MPPCCSTVQLINKGIILPPTELQFPLSNSQSSVIFRQRLRRDRDALLIYRSTNGRALPVLANSNVPPGKRSARKEIIMVDPLEAKRLAAKQMEQLKAKERLKRRRQIEAINGAWAMIGLTAGVVIEGETGKGILSQLAGYWAAIIGFLSLNDLLNNAQSFFSTSL